MMATTVLTLDAGSALAHGPAADVDQSGAETVLEALVAFSILAVTALYVRGWIATSRRLGRAPAAVASLGSSLFLTGQVALGVALLSPLAAIGGLFTAHMIQHVLLVAIAPPLLLAGRPDLFCLGGLPRAWRRALGRHCVFRAALAALKAMARPFPAAVLHGATIWIWHAPAAFEAAERSVWLHALEHFSFVATALLFWQGIVRATRPAAALAGAASALGTSVHSGFLAALIVFSPAVLYPEATAGAPLWDLTPLEDQQFAGTVMWVPAGLAYLLAGLLLAGRAIEPRHADGTATRSGRFAPTRSPLAGS